MNSHVPEWVCAFFRTSVAIKLTIAPMVVTKKIVKHVNVQLVNGNVMTNFSVFLIERSVKVTPTAEMVKILRHFNINNNLYAGSDEKDCKTKNCPIGYRKCG